MLSRRVGAALSGVLAAARRERGVARGVASAEVLKAVAEAAAVRARARSQLRHGAALKTRERKPGADVEKNFRVYHEVPRFSA